MVFPEREGEVTKGPGEGSSGAYTTRFRGVGHEGEKFWWPLSFQ